MSKSSVELASPAPATRGRKVAGRPVGVSNVREQILDAAEQDFANHGYAGTTLREVAVTAGVTQALITYYFGTKQQLFEEVFLRRAVGIASERMRLLGELQAAVTEPSIRDLVRTFLAPMLGLRKSTGGRAFIRLHARLHTEPPEISYRLRSQAYDESMRAYVQAFRQALPGLPEKDLYWRITLMVGAYLYAFSDAHRLEVLSEGICRPDDTNETHEQLLNFIVGGLEAVATASRAAVTPKRRARAAKPRTTN